MKEYVLKTIFIGDTNVGKSSILARKKFNVFDKSNKSTIGIDFITIEETVDDTRIKLNIWDSAGQEKYNNIIQSYFREIAGAFLVYDVTNQKSLDNLNGWIDKIKYYSPNCEIVIVGNKSDKGGTLDMSYYDDIKHKVICSAKKNTGIDEVFNEMIYLLMNKINNYDYIQDELPGIKIYEEFTFGDNEVFNKSKTYSCCSLL